MDAGELIETLGLEPHPEGGYYARTFTHPDVVGGRPMASAIYYLLPSGVSSRWHRIDAAEMWHHYAGAPLRLSQSRRGAAIAQAVLGVDVAAGQRPQLVVPAGVWQSAESLGAFTLVGCTVSPAFSFDGFELAPAGWSPT
ncbi:MAG: cupin domain-containing protein [Actinobacteria bacterium]|nr:cupin domain-containing protein [Actinomycetota bacterium]